MHSGRAALGMGGGSGGPLTNETRALACGPAGILHFPRRTDPPQKKCLRAGSCTSPHLAPAHRGEAAGSPARAHPATPGSPPPTAAVCYLTTDTDIQREPPCDPHPESRRPRRGARCSTAGGSRAAGHPGRAEVR